VTSPEPAASLPDHLRCQTPDCPNPIAVVVTWLDDSEADMLCQTCNMAFWAAVLTKAAEAGYLGDMAQIAPPA
jgi:hypothetical protein